MPPTTYSSFLRPVGSKRQSRAHKVFTDQPTFLRLASSNKRQSRAPSQEGFPQLPNPPSCVPMVASGKAERIRRTSNHSPASRQSFLRPFGSKRASSSGRKTQLTSGRDRPTSKFLRPVGSKRQSRALVCFTKLSPFG